MESSKRSSKAYKNKKNAQHSYKDSVEDMSISVGISAILQESTPNVIPEPQHRKRQPLETLTSNDLQALGLLHDNVTLRSPKKKNTVVVLPVVEKTPPETRTVNGARQKKMKAPVEQWTANWTYQDFFDHCYEDDDINLIRR